MSDQYPQYPQYPNDPNASTPYPGAQPAPAGAGPVYAGWWIRVGASVIDGLIAVAVAIVPVVVGLVMAFSDLEIDPVTDEATGTVDPLGILVLVIGGLVFFGFDIWNRGVRIGTRGQSLGKQLVGVRTLRADTGAVLGGGMGFLRWLVAFGFGFIPFGQLVDVLWPLFDPRKQTLHDKVMSSVSVRS
ncbi:RDD family protein [Aeromicrobium marinum DSM 15272]|uniref:RDD family protein n=1 Tax=Aeromicrobium marinum DSM 15272 TaxID=585531 RepID=E2S930_9ACTN|nr:RDD family protein [Aeromicrobium marinum]EFQ84300.1 RDD family protein [Aeromicrobium marinum DSM 15272]